MEKIAKVQCYIWYGMKIHVKVGRLLPHMWVIITAEPRETSAIVISNLINATGTIQARIWPTFVPVRLAIIARISVFTVTVIISSAGNRVGGFISCFSLGLRVQRLTLFTYDWFLLKDLGKSKSFENSKNIYWNF